MIKYLVEVVPLNIIKLFLALFTTLAIAVNIITIEKINTINDGFSERKNEATWFVFQLVKEYSQFVTEIRITPIETKSLWLHFDLTWSRFDIILNSRESSNFIQDANYYYFFSDQFERFQALENSIKLFESGKIKKEALEHRVILNFDEVINFVNSNFKLQSPLVKKNSHELKRLLLIQKMTTMVLVSLFVIIIIVFWVESLIRKSIFRRDPLTRLMNRSALTHDLKPQFSQTYYSILSIRVLNLDEINQKYGIDYGDILIKSAAEKTYALMDKHFNLYRYSGATLIALGAHNQSLQNEQTLKVMRDSLSEPICLGDLELIMDISLIHEQKVHRSMLLERLTLLSRRKAASTRA
ncbi:diguanylate cyclase domain-containing protein [Vibrio methylphosphonaticus]|uniref:diguanylate cyclase domain-containing protein n=1 Tax=Vibrio methylphosphonaticus TaxID=2946866 RepID=UPI00202ABA26|nr:GGDEF domain-containing protein [Vibrio methylphosphonaticus]MCL9773649.1 GGDEF domain-containing protein [Vibrio methylphosphonaticus]